jgi:hypothetical protein
MIKICKGCGQEKESTEFYPDHHMRDRLKVRCKVCYNEGVAIWQKSNPEKRKTYTHNWYMKNREKSLDAAKKWRSENRERYNEISRNCKRDQELLRKRRLIYEKRTLSTVEGKLKKRFSSYIRDSLIGGKGGRRWESLVGYTAHQLKSHLEARFESWMNWGNYGMPKNGERTWHIDHVIPKSIFSYHSPEDEGFKRCWALHNLQPLEAMANLKKGKKIGGIENGYCRER